MQNDHIPKFIVLTTRR